MRLRFVLSLARGGWGAVREGGWEGGGGAQEGSAQWPSPWKRMTFSQPERTIQCDLPGNNWCLVVAIDMSRRNGCLLKTCKVYHNLESCKTWRKKTRISTCLTNDSLRRWVTAALEYSCRLYCSAFQGHLGYAEQMPNIPQSIWACGTSAFSRPAMDPRYSVRRRMNISHAEVELTIFLNPSWTLRLGKNFLQRLQPRIWTHLAMDSLRYWPMAGPDYSCRL